MRYIKAETANKPLKCSPEMLEAMRRNYYEGGGRERIALAYRNKTPEQLAKMVEATKRWKARNRDRVRLHRIATSAKFRAKKYAGDFETWDIMGCNVAELGEYLDRVCPPGMDWRDGRRFEIDHIRPLCGFDLSDHAQLREALHYTNLQVIPRAKHEEKSKPEHAAFMEAKSRVWWAKNGQGDYPGPREAWKALSRKNTSGREEMERYAEKWWKENKTTEYPGFAMVWKEISRPKHLAKVVA